MLAFVYAFVLGTVSNGLKKGCFRKFKHYQCYGGKKTDR